MLHVVLTGLSGLDKRERKGAASAWHQSYQWSNVFYWLCKCKWSDL